MAKPANEEILDATIRHQIKVLRFSEGQAQQAASLLAASDLELVALLETGLTDTSRHRIEKLLRDVRSMRAATAEQVRQELQSDLSELAVMESDWETSMLTASSPVPYTFHGASTATLKAVSSSPINGVPLEGWLSSMEANDISRIEQQINLGVLQGETISQMVGRIRGTKAAGYADGVLNTTRREAEMIARTATNHISNAARQSTWDANADIISGVRWVATLDGRTSSTCQGRDGEVFPIDKGPRPPAHPNCRSTIVPILHGEEILGTRATVTDTRTTSARETDFRREAREAAGDKWKGMSQEERTDAIRARRKAWVAENVGSVSTATNYQTWLSGQSHQFQNEVLGPGKASLFRNGTPLSKFIDETGKPYSLAQLKAEYSGDKLNVIQPGVGLKAKSLLQQGMTTAEVLEQIKAEFPDAKTSAASIASYKSELNKAGALNVPEVLVPSGSLKQAQSVAGVVETLDNSLPANIKHAIGGQWSTVVDTLDGSPGAYGYYEAGKGVVLSGSKLATVPLAQAQQIAAHELGHLLHKQHDLLLPDDVLAALKSSAKSLSPDARKVYSYYLTSPDELIAELYAQALSPSTLTSQGLNALEFNKVFGDAISASKISMANKFPVPPMKAKAPIPGGPVTPGEVAGKHTTVGSLSKALLQQGMPDEMVLQAVLAEFPTAKTKIASIQSYKSQLKKEGLLINKASGPVVHTKAIPDVVKAPAPALTAELIPETALKGPSPIAVSPAQLKAEAIKMMESGLLANKDVAEALLKQFPLNAEGIKLNNIATWKTLWKKANPKDFAVASNLSAKATRKVADIAPALKPPKLLDQPMGSYSTKVLSEIESSIMAGGTTQDAYAIMEKMFGSVAEPGASDLLELARWKVLKAKAAGKPYLNAALTSKTPKVPDVPKATPFVIDETIEAYVGTLNKPYLDAIEGYVMASKNGLSPMKTEAFVKKHAGLVPHAAAVDKLKAAADYQIKKEAALGKPKPKKSFFDDDLLEDFEQNKGLEEYISILGDAKKSVIEGFKQAFAEGLTGADADAFALKFSGVKPTKANPYHPLKMAAEYEAKKEAFLAGGGKLGVPKGTFDYNDYNFDMELSKVQLPKYEFPPAGLPMEPTRLAFTPREGLPPPPRFTEAQRALGLSEYAGYVDPRVAQVVNSRQRGLGLPDLTAEEASAVRSYTGGAYRRINEALREGLYATDPRLQAYVDAAQQGLMKMPKHSGTTVRGVSLSGKGLEDLLSSYYEGAIVEDAAFVSTSYGGKAAFSGNVHIHVNGQNGVNVSKISKHSSEREVLFMPGTRFKVDSVTNEYGTYIIKLTEI